MWIPKGYHPFKLISAVAEMLVKKRGIGKPTQKKKKGIRKLVQKKKTGNNNARQNPVRRVKNSIRGQRMVRKDIFS